MTQPPPENPLEVYERNLEVYELSRLHPSRTFVSHWDIDNPLLAALSERLAARRLADGKDVGRYQYFDDNTVLPRRIVSLHRNWEGIDIEPGRLLLGDGGSALITTFLLWAKAKGLRTLHYVPPIYYTFHKLAALIGIRLSPVSGMHGFQEGFDPRLPPSGGLVYVADPMWYVGRRHAPETYAKLRAWQEETGGTVFVDGSFQFMQWEGTRAERCVVLLPEQTFRLVSPTKAMALHALRFAYLACPGSAERDELNLIYEDSHGPSSLAHQRLAEDVMGLFDGEPGNAHLMAYARRQFLRLQGSGALRGWVTPECCNFAFVDIREPGPEWLGLSSEHFEIRGYEGYMRVNLLNDRIVASILGD